MFSRPPRALVFAALMLIPVAFAFAQNGEEEDQQQQQQESAEPTYFVVSPRRVIHIEGYKPTPGDVYTLSINYGIDLTSRTAAQTENIQLILNSDYTMEIPFVGSLNVRSLDYDELRTEVTSRVKEKSFAQFVSLNLTEPAVFDVLVWGGVTEPGYQPVNSLTRLDEVLEAAQGPSPVGSQRQVELIRGTQTQVLDLKAYETRGEASQNPLLEPGDQIRVPLLLSALEVRGAVAQPGTIEILDGETVGDLIELAGGLLPTAQLSKATISRLGDNNRYSILSGFDSDLRSLPAQNGDIVTIPASTRSTELVQIEGAIYTTPAEEGTPRNIPMQPILLDVPYTPGLTVLGVLEQLGGPTPFAELERSFIIRADSGERSPLPDLEDVWESRMADRDIVLAPGDRLVIPMKRLVVSVAGEVNRPGGFAFTSGYVVEDYLELAGGVVEQDGSLSRVFFVDGDGSRTRVDASTPVPIGANIYVGRSAWGEAKRLFDNIFVVTGWATGLIGVATAVINFISLF